MFLMLQIIKGIPYIPKPCIIDRHASFVTGTYWSHLSLSQRWGQKEIHEKVDFFLLKRRRDVRDGFMTQALAGWGTVEAHS